jgi:hypothetical protein
MLTFKTFMVSFCQLVLTLAYVPCVAMEFASESRCFEDLEPKCQKMIIAVGIITKDTPKQFTEFSQPFPAGTYVLFSSKGGMLDSGLMIGKRIREAKFNTIIGNTEFSSADCLSACAYAFFGGVLRNLPSTGHLGLHHYYSKTQIIDIEQQQRINQSLSRYLEGMGIDPRLLEYANSAKSTNMTYITERQAKEYKISQ